MTTSAIIALKHSDGSYTTIKQEMDGHPKHAGKILIKRFNTVQKLKALFLLGDIKSLKAKLTDIETLDAAQATNFKNWYHFENYATESNVGYVYIMLGNIWYFRKITDGNYSQLKFFLETINNK